MIDFNTTKPNTEVKPQYSSTKTGFNKNTEVEAFLKDLRLFSMERGKQIKKPIVEFAKTAAKFITKQIKAAAKYLKF